MAMEVEKENAGWTGLSKDVGHTVKESRTGTRTKRDVAVLSEHTNEEKKGGTEPNGVVSESARSTSSMDDLQGRLLSLPQQVAALSAALRTSNENLRSCHLSLSKAVKLDGSQRMNTPNSAVKTKSITPPSPGKMDAAALAEGETSPSTAVASAIEQLNNATETAEVATRRAAVAEENLSMLRVEMERKLTEAQDKYDTLWKELHAKQDTMRGDSEARVYALQEEIKSEKARNTSLKTELEEKLSQALAENVALTTNHGVQTETLQIEQAAAIEKLTLQLEEAQTNLENVQREKNAEAAQWTSRVSELQSNLESLQHERDSESAELANTLEKTKQDYELRIKEVEAMVHQGEGSAAEHIQTLQQQMESARTEKLDAIAQLEAKISESNAKVSHLQVQLSSEIERQSNLQEELVQLRSTKRELEEALEGMQAKVTEVEEKLSQLSQEKEDLQEELNCSQTMCSSLQDGIQQKLRDIQMLHEEVDAQKSHNEKELETLDAKQKKQMAELSQHHREDMQKREAEIEEKLALASQEANQRVTKAEQDFALEKEDLQNAFTLEKEALQNELEAKQAELQDELDLARRTAEEIAAKHSAEIRRIEDELREAFVEEKAGLQHEAEAKQAELNGQLDQAKEEAAKLSEQYQAELSRMKAELEEQLAKVQSEAEEKIRTLDETHASELFSVREKHDAEIVSHKEALQVAVKEKQVAEDAQNKALLERRSAEEEAARAQHSESLARKEAEEAVNRYRKEFLERRKIFKQLQELKGNVRVMARVRPLLLREVETGGKECASYPEVGCIEISQPAPKGAPPQQTAAGRKQKYEYDEVFMPSSSQQDVFEATEPLLISVLDGYNCSIFAYGQTGSGKTFTMEGEGEEAGIAQRIIESLYEGSDVRSKAGWKYTFTLSAIEIYNEQVLDLLQARRPSRKTSWVGTGGDGKASQQERGSRIEVRETADGVSLPGLVKVVCGNAEDALTIIQKVQSQRATETTKMNDRSSRSHSIIMIDVDAEDSRADAAEGPSAVRLLSGHLALVDLAGSERLNRSEASGERLKEAQHINKSLSALGDVIASLANKSKHVPYRNSTLTRVLRESLQQGGKALLMACVSAADLDAGETCCTLGFAQRTRGVECGAAKRNVK